MFNPDSLNLEQEKTEEQKSEQALEQNSKEPVNISVGATKKEKSDYKLAKKLVLMLSALGMATDATSGAEASKPETAADLKMWHKKYETDMEDHRVKMRAESEKLKAELRPSHISGDLERLYGDCSAFELQDGSVAFRALTKEKDKILKKYYKIDSKSFDFIELAIEEAGKVIEKEIDGSKRGQMLNKFILLLQDGLISSEHTKEMQPEEVKKNLKKEIAEYAGKDTTIESELISSKKFAAGLCKWLGENCAVGLSDGTVAFKVNGEEPKYYRIYPDEFDELRSLAVMQSRRSKDLSKEVNEENRRGDVKMMKDFVKDGREEIALDEIRKLKAN